MKMSQQDYKEKAEIFLRMLKSSMPVTTGAGARVYDTMEKGRERFTQSMNALEGILKDVSITSSAKKFVVGILTPLYATGIPPIECFSPAGFFGIDLDDCKYGFFDPRNAEIFERNMIRVCRRGINNVNFPDEGVEVDILRKLNTWIGEFKEKYGHAPVLE